MTLHYFDLSGNPITACPRCGSSLTKQHSLEVACDFAGGGQYGYLSRLDDRGRPACGNVDPGRVRTYCGGCGARLAETEGVEEVDLPAVGHEWGG